MSRATRTKPSIELMKNNKGQSILEYVVLTGLIGILCLSVVKQFGQVLETRIRNMKESVVREIR